MMTTLRTFSRTLLIATIGWTGIISAQDSEYQIGRGVQINDALTVGSYFSTEYINGNDDDKFVIDDLAVLVYGDFDNGFSYLLELESVDAWELDFENNESETNLPPTIERLYGDYKFSDTVSVRFGKQITPMGYWNLQPINVLRETTSNPRFSRKMFPKFLTGVDVYGFAPFDRDLTYHVYMQNSRDMDEDNINIKTDQHYGFSFEKRLRNDWQYGGSFGRFRETDKTRTRYFQLNSKYERNQYTFTTEGIVNFQDLANGRSVDSQSIYMQGEYRFQPRHSLISRVEYYDDEKFNIKERIGVVGYSYRPVYPVSFKIEYQWHADTKENQFVGSFSVLF